MKKGCLILFAFACAAILTAADYRVKSVKVLPLESYPARIAIEGVTIAVDPYETDEKSFSAFDIKNLNSRGYFPLHVIIHNASQSFLKLGIRNVTLVTKSGQQLYTTPATVLVDDVVKSGLVQKSKGKDKTQTSPLADFTGKELTNQTVDPGSTSDGFLFFFTDQPKKNLFSGSTLLIPKLEEEGTRKILGPFSIPLDPALSAKQ
jgi:hypothetical protein